MNILETIVESKKREIERLYEQYDFRELSEGVTANHPLTSNEPLFYRALAESREAGRPFFIAEFKRKSPSEGWINRGADLPAQVLAYTQAGAGAISVLTDEPYFGGSYSDLKSAANTVHRPPSTVHRPPSTVYRPPSTVYRPPSTVHRPPSTVHRPPSTVHRPPLILQKDFILDPIQIYLAKLHGADIILLIAAILAPERLDFLKKTAESLGLCVLVEVHDAEEYAQIQHLDFPVLGVNNRDLKTFRTALNRVNVLAADGGRWTVDGGRWTVDGRRWTVDGRRWTVDGGRWTVDGGRWTADGGRWTVDGGRWTVDGGRWTVDGGRWTVDGGRWTADGGRWTVDGGRGTVNGNTRYIIAESGIRDYRDFQAVRGADGFLIGTGLMRGGEAPNQFEAHFQSRGRFLLKACGIRTPEILSELSQAVNQSHRLTVPDFIGINFSPVSKRRADAKTLQVLKTCKVSNAIAVFYKNPESEIREILEQYPFRAAQFYADEVTPEFVRSLQQRVVLAVRVSENLTWAETLSRYVEPFAADVDFFILDGAVPGSGQRIGVAIPTDFPYPFLLAGGLREENLEAVTVYKNCIGVDIASGIETEGQVDLKKIGAIAMRLRTLHSELEHGAISE